MEHTPSSAVVSELMSLRGNEKCYDCSGADNVWGSINMGILLCIDCAGKHRRFGVNVSFVRSLYMDSWSDQQLEMMRQEVMGDYETSLLTALARRGRLKTWPGKHSTPQKKRNATE